jgi:hypothetical protein
MRFLTVLVLLLLPAVVLAGPNAGGVLLVHANTSIVYTTDTTDYCGQSGLAACSEAIATAPWSDTTTVFHVIAAFPDTALPRLKAISWGVRWDASRLVIVNHGTCADFEIPDAGWPQSETGIGQSWEDTREALMAEVYWFAAYCYGAPSDTTSLVLTPHPVQGGWFVDDEEPPNLDQITAYGRLGFGIPGFVPCEAPQPPPGIYEPEVYEPDTPMESDIPPITFTVQVLDEASGLPIPGVRITMSIPYVRVTCDCDCASNCDPPALQWSDYPRTSDNQGFASVTKYYYRCTGNPPCNAYLPALNIYPSYVIDPDIDYPPSTQFICVRVEQSYDHSSKMYLRADSAIAEFFAPVLHRHYKDNMDALDYPDHFFQASNATLTVLCATYAPFTYSLSDQPLEQYSSSTPPRFSHSLKTTMLSRST